MHLREAHRWGTEKDLYRGKGVQAFGLPRQDERKMTRQLEGKGKSTSTWSQARDGQEEAIWSAGREEGRGKAGGRGTARRVWVSGMGRETRRKLR